MKKKKRNCKLRVRCHLQRDVSVMSKKIFFFHMTKMETLVFSSMQTRPFNGSRTAVDVEGKSQINFSHNKKESWNISISAKLVS